MKSSFRVRGLPEDPNKSREENALFTNEKLNEVLDEIGVKVEKLQRLGKFGETRKTLRNVIFNLINNWDVRRTKSFREG